MIFSKHCLQTNSAAGNLVEFFATLRCKMQQTPNRIYTCPKYPMVRNMFVAFKIAAAECLLEGSFWHLAKRHVHGMQKKHEKE